MRHMLILSLIAGLALSTTSCVSLLPEPAAPPTIYRLNSDSAPVQKLNAAKVLRVDTPIVPASLRGPDIALSPDGRVIAYADGAKWDAPVPGLIQRAIIEGFDGSAALRAVSSKTGAESDYLLSVTVRSYEAVFINGKKTAPEARVVFDVSIVKAGGRQLVGNRLFRTDAMASEFRIERIVIAQENATNQAVSEIVRWAEERISAQSIQVSQVQYRKG